MNIKNWLTDFKDMWLNKEFSNLSNLFSEKNEYWENPYKKLGSFRDLEKEWQEVGKHSINKLEFKLVSSDGDLFTIKWEYKYKSEGEVNHWLGLYLVRLNNENKCSYFYQVGEKK